jgi:orotate phosphoribosyltransferase
LSVQAEEILDQFRASGAMLEGHFALSSGLHSDRFFQCALLLMDPRRAEAIATSLARLVRDRGVEVDLVIGPALGAVTWAHEVGRALGVRAMFTERKGEKGSGMVLRRGFTIQPGERVLVVEDVLTTGGSVREVLECVRELGGEPVGVGAILNRSGKDPFENDGVPLLCLAEVEAKTWDPQGCPMCADGSEAYKPGSRPGQRVGGSSA